MTNKTNDGKGAVKQAAQAAVVRLRQQREDNEAAWTEVGRLTGVEWAAHACYSCLTDAAKQAEVVLSERGVIWSSVELPETMDDAMRECERGERGPGFNRDAFVEGFLRGVLELWNEVEEQL